jgi:hypothetical protein
VQWWSFAAARDFGLLLWAREDRRGADGALTRVLQGRAQDVSTNSRRLNLARIRE